MKTFTPKVREAKLVCREIGDEFLLYDLLTDKAICLNSTASAVWHLCNGKRTAADISADLSKMLGADFSEELVNLAFSQLARKSLFVNNAEVDDVSEGMRRREAIKKIGFAAAVTLPIVSSIVAPRSTAAQSPAPFILDSCSMTSPVPCICDTPGQDACLDAVIADTGNGCYLINDVTCNAGVPTCAEIPIALSDRCCKVVGGPSGTPGVGACPP